MQNNGGVQKKLGTGCLNKRFLWSLFIHGASAPSSLGGANEEREPNSMQHATLVCHAGCVCKISAARNSADVLLYFQAI